MSLTLIQSSPYKIMPAVRSIIRFIEIKNKPRQLSLGCILLFNDIIYRLNILSTERTGNFLIKLIVFDKEQLFAEGTL